MSSAGLGPESDCSLWQGPQAIWWVKWRPVLSSKKAPFINKRSIVRQKKEIWSWTLDGSSSTRQTGRLTLNRNLTSASNYAGNKHKPFKIMKKYIFEILDKAKPDTETIRGLNWAAAKRRTDQVTEPPSWQERLNDRAYLLYRTWTERCLVCIIYT
jgi:hypothetical protein